MQLDSTLSATARPFQPRVTPQSSREDDVPRSHPVRHRLAGSSPTPGFAPDSPMRRALPSHHQSSDDDGVSTDTSISDKPPRRRHGSRRSQSSQSSSDSDGTHSSGGRRKKRMDFQVRSRSANSEARRAIRMMWLVPSSSGPAASRTIVITMRISTSCPW